MVAIDQDQVEKEEGEPLEEEKDLVHEETVRKVVNVEDEDVPRNIIKHMSCHEYLEKELDEDRLARLEREDKCGDHERKAPKDHNQGLVDMQITKLVRQLPGKEFPFVRQMKT